MCIPLIGLLLPCCGSPPAALPPFEPARFDAVLSMPRADALFAIDALEPADQHPASAVWWLTLQRDRDAAVELRTRAAVAVAECGFAEGEQFCLAVLGANLGAEYAGLDRRFGLPEEDRWAFAREIALAWLRSRLLAAGKKLPEYDVNFGAPQMLAAARAYAKAMEALPKLTPQLTASALERIVPAQSSLASIAKGEWSRARQDCIAACASASPPRE